MRRIFLFLLLLITFGNRAFGYGAEGHRIVGKVADFRLKSAHARHKVRSLLIDIHAESLADIANWADEVKRQRVPKSTDDPETVAFLAEHPAADTGPWHFVDLPLGTKRYDPSTIPKFVRSNDIVHILNHCIARLQGKIEPDFAISELNALRLLVHLVGDIHQPFHVVSGYIDENQQDPSQWIISDPVKAEKLSDDAGGNRLILPSKKNMHFVFDVDLVRSVVGASTVRDTALRLTKVHVDRNGKMSGPPETWPAQWADDTLKVGRKVYKSIKIISRRQASDRPSGWNVAALPSQEEFEKKNTGSTSRQLAKAGARLAAVLDAIWPDQ